MQWLVIFLIILIGKISVANSMQDKPSQSYKKLEFEINIDTSFNCTEKFYIGVDGFKLLNNKKIQW